MNFRQDRCQLADSNRECLSGGSSYHRQGCLVFSLVIFKFSKPRASHPGQCQSYTVKCLLINSIFYLNICLLFLLVFIIVFILITIWHLLYDQYLLHYLFNFHAISHIVQARKLERLSKISKVTQLVNSKIQTQVCLILKLLFRQLICLFLLSRWFHSFDQVNCIL